MVFAFGYATDGALGLSTTEPGRGDRGDFIETPRLIDFFFDKLITIRCIACGGDPMAGGHSAAVSTDGKVYTWGIGVALGNQSTRSHAEPQLITLPDLEDLELKQLAPELHSSPSIQSISCGSGFCVALAETGHAFAWGKWSDGRLGLGRIPILNQSSRRHGRRRQFQAFQLTPKQLSATLAISEEGSSHHTGRELLFVKVECGEAHCIGLTRSGAIVAWGRGSHGQLGHGATHDAQTPIEVQIAGELKLKWRDVAAGENWSMALDVHGRVWTWGACGGSVLGLGNGTLSRTAVVTEMILQRHSRLLKQQPPVAVSPPPLPRLDWMHPQLVSTFGNGGIRVEKLSAGRQHAAAVSTDGDLYLWGDGNGFSSLPNLVRSMSSWSSGSSKMVPGDETVTDTMGSEIVEHVVCGGDVVIAFTSGSFLARSMQTLHHQCELLSKEHQDLDPATFREVTSRLATDVVLLVSGKRLFAHKLVLARRSPVLRDLIQNEQRSGGAPCANGAGNQSGLAGGEIMELLLPQLRYDVAKVLIEYMYTDNFSLMLDPQSYLVRDVQRAAQLYKLPALEKLCCELLRAGEAPPPPALPTAAPIQSGAAVFPLNKLGVSAASKDEGRQSLNADLQFVLGDPAWSDLTLIAEGNEIPVHRCVLVARSEYFRALLGFGAKHDWHQHHHHRPDKDSSGGRDVPGQVVHVDESYVGMLRVLKFIYNDHVSTPPTHHNQQCDSIDSQQEREQVDDDGDDDETDQLLEDLVAADKYGLARFKRLCEHAIHVNTANCLEVLSVADIVSASHLKQVRWTQCWMSSPHKWFLTCGAVHRCAAGGTGVPAGESEDGGIRARVRSLQGRLPTLVGGARRPHSTADRERNAAAGTCVSRCLAVCVV